MSIDRPQLSHPDVESRVSAAPSTASRTDADHARAALTTLQRSLRDSSGRIHTGLLRLRRNAAGPLPQFEHQSSFHLKRPSRTQLQETAQALLRLFESAGMPAQAQVQLERYLRDNGDRAQVGRIAALLDEHLPATVLHATPALRGSSGD